MNSNEVRKAFLDYFTGKSHKVIPSSSLIPRDDPTLLLTTAGMVQIKPYFLGLEAPPAPRLASCQKCFRTTDIESVGDASHCTFFEMLGNFSVGDYFKQEAIDWAWEFVTGRLQMPEERLRITVFRDDDEAFHIWRKVGITESKITRLDEKDNFWGPAGDSGPCGPCSEIHYDFGRDTGCGKPSCAPGCDCGRFCEIWNLVFTQYNQDKSGKRTPLPRTNIDTGMGMERVTVVMQGKSNLYDTDLFVPLIEKVCRLSGKKYGVDKETDRAVRVVAEHSRGLAFLIADGVIPGNEGRGYVLRRILRRAGLFGRRLGLVKPFLTETAGTTIEQMGHIYPELVQRQDFILKVIEHEEARFSDTLSTGLELLDGIIAEKKAGKEISGADAFKLYDTYGFPVELTREIASREGLMVDMAGFTEEMAKQKERARAAHKFAGEINGGAPEELGLDIAETPFVGYHNLTSQSVIIAMYLDGKPAEEIKQGQEASLVLETTSFYGEMGGQVGDTGEIRGSSGRFLVTDTVRLVPGIIVHKGRVAAGNFSVGDEIAAVVDMDRRLSIARNHTATHLLQTALRQVLGEHVQQRGSVVAPDRLRFDFSHLTTMTGEEIEKVNNGVNEKIRQNLPVYDHEMSYRRAVDLGAIALFEEKYGDVVRVLSIGDPPVSVELCGGTHVIATGQIGFFRIVSESSIGAGLRRIEAVTGSGAEGFVNSRLQVLSEVARAVGAEGDDVLARVASLDEELKKERKLRQSLESELSRKTAESLLNQVETINGVRVLSARVPSCRIETLREMSDFLRDKLESVVLVLGTIYEERPLFLAAVTPDLVAKGYDAGKIVKKVDGVVGGGGGGKAELAQAGGKYREKVDEALRLVKSLV